MEEYVCVTPFTVYVHRIRDGRQQVLVKHIEAGRGLSLSRLTRGAEALTCTAVKL